MCITTYWRKTMILSDACRAITEAKSLHDEVYKEGYCTGLDNGQKQLADESTIEHHVRLLEEERTPKSTAAPKKNNHSEHNEPHARPSPDDVEHEEAVCAGYIMGWLIGATEAMEPWMKEGQAKP